MRQKSIAVFMAGIMLLAMTGCADNPDSAVVKEKNLDRMIEQAEDDKEGSKSLKDVAGEVNAQYDTYKTQITDESLGVTVDVDARVEIPETESLSVYRVSQQEIGQDFLDKVKEVLTPDGRYYDGYAADIQTKADIAKLIQEEKDMLGSMEVGKDGIPDEETLEMYKTECQDRISGYESQYQQAPDNKNITDYPSDNQIHMVKELCEKDAENSFYQWEYELNPNGSVYYGISDGADGNYRVIYLQNNENYGNCFRYESARTGYIDWVHSAVVEENRNQFSVLKKEGEMPDFSGAVGIESESQLKLCDDEPATLSETEAKEKAEEFLGKIGLDDYKCYDAGLYSELCSYEKEAKYRDLYSFLYMRTIDGVFVNNTAGAKLTDEWRGDDYVKKQWGNEAVVVGVNDSGIVLFNWLTPVSVDETVVEKSSIKSFNEIKDTFEQMVVIENALDAEGEKVSIRVTNVKLIYTRISEKDSFDTGLIVPVWDFEGTVVDEYGGEKTGNILSINAIDGSVIDSELGY